MSAETLRRAGALMRERAEAATPAPEMGPRPWMVDPDEPAVVLQPDEPTGWDGYAVALTHSNEADKYVYTPHIASWHPAVALAVAQWLNDCAQFYSDFPGYTHDGEDYALAVARAYLGEDA